MYKNFFRYILPDRYFSLASSIENHQGSDMKDKRDKKIDDKKSSSNSSPEINAIQAKVHALIDDENRQMLQVFIDNHYSFAPTHLEKLFFSKNNLSSTLSTEARGKIYQDNWDILGSKITENISYFGYCVNHKEVFELSSHYSAYSISKKNYDIIENYQKSIAILSEKYSNKNNFLDTEEIYHIYYATKKNEDYLAEFHTGSKYLAADNFIRKHHDFFMQIKEVFNATHGEVFTKMAQRANSLQGLKDNISQEIADSIKGFEREKLPASSQKILCEIESLYQDLSRQDASIVQKLDIENLYHKRLPQILGNFIVIPQQYRERLLAESDNPENLLEENLIILRDKLVDISENVFDGNIQNLKKSKQYLKYLG